MFIFRKVRQFFCVKYNNDIFKINKILLLYFCTKSLQKNGGFVSIFFDDIILWSTDPETHKKKLLRLFEVLSKEKLSLNMNKCYFFARYVKYLGIIVGQG